MLTLFHAPNSRSSAIMTLIDEMGIADRVKVETVTISRFDGSGAADPANPHPEGKTPVLVHDGRIITERAAIILHLATLFPDSGLAPRIGTPDWGTFAAWLCWYQGVLEPVLIHQMAGLEHLYLTRTFRGPKEAAARLRSALDKGPWLMGADYSAADLLVHSPFAWAPQAMPDDPVIRDWVGRCMARPARARTVAADTARMAELAAG